MKKRVVITGLGIVSPIGNEVNEAYTNAINGVNGINTITSFDTSDLKVKIAAQVKDFDQLKHLSKRDARRQDLFCQYAVYAASEAYQDAGLNDENHKASDLGVIIGTGMGGMQTFAKDLNTAFEKGISKIPPMFVPMIIPNMAAGNVAIALNAQNHCSCTTTACSAGTNAIGDAFKWIQMGNAKVMMAGGSEAGVCLHTLSGFNALSALSTNEDPNNASRPFDADRDGFVLGEGSGVLILEELEHAKARNAKIYAEIVGYGSTCDAYHITSPSGVGAISAIKMALKDANVEANKIDYINAHGTSTPLNDKFESAAIKEVFSDNLDNLSISSTKSMHGHALGGAGGIEAVLTIKTIENNIIPPTINYKNFDEDCDLDYTPNVKKEKTVNYAISNSLGFGGHNAIIVFRKYGE
ncbi:3-oxoacyl-[acyl-carrier-protein] synthase II [Bacilli bacterium PM5-9]|nr:3-oxoacyl-[acyl-carrier-protein] synthase II [Bacilli bacterium PM5-9]